MSNGIAKTVVFVVGGKRSMFAEKVCDVAVGVAGVEEVGAGQGGDQDTANAADALEGGGEVEAPEVGGCDRAADASQGEVGLGNVGVRCARDDGGL